MLASLNWINDLSGCDVSAQEAAERLTSAGIEVEAIQPIGADLDGIVVAEVRGNRQHPERDKLKLVTVFDGTSLQEVVCGAPNVPEPGKKVALARLGTVLPSGLEIEERRLGTVVSCGMLCSEFELNIGLDETGIIVLDDDAQVKCGDKVSQALGLEDTIFDIGITPNRPDCLGHLGLARELCLLLKKPFNYPQPMCPARIIQPESAVFPQANQVFSLFDSCDWERPQEESCVETEFKQVKVEIIHSDRCPRYGAALVDNVTIKPSPFWMRYRLHILGVRAINNVVDATNYILLGLGHPIHAFDYDTLNNSCISIRLAEPQETIVTLDGEQRKLTDDDLLICDGKGPIALAGIMGGQNSEIGIETKRVLIECAYFDPRSIRRTSKRTGLHTDSSHRFERGMDPNAIPMVLAHAAALIAQQSKGTVILNALDIKPISYQPLHLLLRFKRLEQLLGCSIDRKTMVGIFKGIGCHVSDTDQGLELVVPSFRPDITREVDLIEEVARVRGYDSIPVEIPRACPSVEGTPPFSIFVRRVQTAAAAAGLDQSINFAFVAARDLANAGVSQNAVELANPLSEEHAVMRTSLLPGLLSNLLHAQHHQVRRFQQFELGRVFFPRSAGELPQEKIMLSVLIWGHRKDWYSESESLDFYDCKGRICTIVSSLSSQEPTTHLCESLPKKFVYLHPKRCATIHLRADEIGHLGELHPNLVDRVKLQGRPIYAQIDLEKLMNSIDQLGIKQVHPLPRYPSVTRDLAVIVKEELSVGEVALVIKEEAGGIAEDVYLFDIYRGKPIQEGLKSLAFRVVYREQEATLTDSRVEKIHAKVLRATEKRFGATIRTHP